MLDHISLHVPDLKKSTDFYKKVLTPLGYRVWVEEDTHVGFGDSRRPYFWLNKGNKKQEVHIAFSAIDRQSVDAFFDAGITSGGKENGKPGLRAEYHPDYYGAFILDLDGNNIEAVCHKKF